MGFLKSSLEILSRPSKFFESRAKSGDLRNAIKAGSIYISIAAILKSIILATSFIPGSGLQDYQGLLLLKNLAGSGSFTVEGIITVSFFDALVGGLLLIFLEAAILHLFTKLFTDSTGYWKTLSVVAYSAVLTPLVAIGNLISIGSITLGIVAQLYGLYIIVRGLESYHQIELSRAALIVAFPLILAFIFGYMFTIGSMAAA